MTKVKFVPNTSSAETNEQIVTQHAEKVLQNPEVIVMVPFAEVEAAITTSETNAQLVNVCAGEVSYSPVETETLGPMSGHHLPPEKPSALGEKIAGELDKLEDEDYFFTSDYVWTRRQPHQYPDGTPVVSVEAVITAGVTDPPTFEVENTMSLAQDLNDLLVKARDAYYTGNPTMTDAEYDSKEAELKALDPNAPILKVVGDTKSTSGRVAHVRPMLSIENFYTKDEIRKFFIDKCTGGFTALIEPKRDGISCELRYHMSAPGQPLELTMALTRGDGDSGEDMTAQVRALKNVPSTLKVIEAYMNQPEVDNLHVRGELVMSKTELDRINAEVIAKGGKPYMSTRNLTAGTMKQKDLSVVASRDIQFIPWDAYSPEQDVSLPDSSYRRMLMLFNYGFAKYEGQVVFSESFVIPKVDEILAANEKSDIIADGVVIKVDSHQLRSSLGVSSNTTNYQVCFKPQNAKGITHLREVIWSNGRTGKLTPVGIVDPIVLAGATITRVNLNNITWIRNLGLKINSRIEVIRSGDVIPVVTRVLDGLPE